MTTQNIRLHPKHKLYYREGSYDKNTMGETKRSYGWLQLQNRKVLDIGGHLGSFSAFALRAGAKTVVTVEPDKGNFKLLTKNMKQFDNVTLFNAAVVSDVTVETHLYKTNGVSHGNYSTTPFRGRTKVKVDTIAFSNILREYKPSVLKMDCEGCEYDVLMALKKLPHVRQVAMEIHLNKAKWRNEFYYELLNIFKDWECVVEPKNTGKNWATIGGWRK